MKQSGERFTLMSLCCLILNLTRLTSSVSECVSTSHSLTDSVIANDDVRRNLLDKTVVASDLF